MSLHDKWNINSYCILITAVFIITVESEQTVVLHLTFVAFLIGPKHASNGVGLTGDGQNLVQKSRVYGPLYGPSPWTPIILYIKAKKGFFNNVNELFNLKND